jgi:hypothetical protein
MFVQSPHFDATTVVSRDLSPVERDVPVMPAHGSPRLCAGSLNTPAEIVSGPRAGSRFCLACGEPFPAPPPRP